jgi:hypothetical protein
MAQASKAAGEKPLASRMMPRDVTTRWNFTYEMLNFAYTYRAAYNEITANRDMKMRKYEIQDTEWKTVEQLTLLLKVSVWSTS